MSRPAVPRAEFLDLGFDAISENDAVAAVAKLADGSDFSYVVTPNVDHLVQLHRRPSDAELWMSYRSADLCLCDSRVLQALARTSGIELPLVPGSDLTARLLAQTPNRRQSVAVVGGNAEMIVILKRRFLNRTWHHHIPPMGVRSDPSAQQGIIDFIEATAADVIFFAIGAPQSELLCRRISERGRARGIALCIGASLEFITGSKRRAPLWMQRLKLEWFFRLLAEPRRLARRYLVEGPEIFRIWYRWRQRSRFRDEYGSSRSGEK